MKLTLMLLAALCSLSAYADSSPKVSSIGARCLITENAIEGGAPTVHQAAGDCSLFETAGLLQRKDDRYQFTDLAIAMGTSRWQAISAALPKLSKPAYYLHADVMGAEKKIPITPGKPSRLQGSVNFAYVGECFTEKDLRAMRTAVLAGNDTTSVSNDASARRPHAPATNESVTMRNGAWVYDLQLVASEQSADGSVRVVLSGTSSGPTNYDAEASKQCNGYTPQFVTVQVPETTVMVSAGKQRVGVPLLGDIGFQIDSHK